MSIDEMAEKGVHLGHKTSKLHPKMAEFVVGIKNTVHVIDLEKTEDMLKKALDFVGNVIKEKGKVMIIGTKSPLRYLVKEKAEESKMPYVVERWLGGTFTNFDVLQKRAKYFSDLRTEKQEGKLEKYTKKEQLVKEKELKDLDLKFSGTVDLEKLPEAVFICDIVKDDLALKESRMTGVKVIAICDTNADISLVDYPIPANDDAISSVSYILEKLVEVINKNK